MRAKKVDRLDSKNFDDYCSGYVNHIAKWDGTAWKALYTDSNDEQETPEEHKEKSGRMTLTDVMTVFRQIIGHIARINKTGAVKIEDVAHDMGVDIADVRLWLRLMESMGIVQVDMQDDLVVLRLPMLDYIGFDTRNLEAE